MAQGAIAQDPGAVETATRQEGGHEGSVAWEFADAPRLSGRYDLAS